jgi:hypothetical protein
VRTFGALLAAVGLASAALVAQSGAVPAGANYGADPSYKVSRTPDGHPDLQGVWANNHVTPMTRPTQWKDRATISDAELKDLQKLVATSEDDGGDAIFSSVIQLALDAKEKGTFDQKSRDGDTGNYNQFWLVDHDWDTRTALIIDPPNGQFPPMTPDGKARQEAARKENRSGAAGSGRPLGPEDLPPSVRCLTFGAPRTGAGYNSYVQILQSPEAVILQQEMIHDARVVPMDGRAHLPASMRQLHGDPRGRWEGDTLVVENTNYSEGFMGSTKDVKVTERYTRVSNDFINWVVTVEDSKTWTEPWSMMIRLKKTKDLLYEYACHEGNYSAPGILAGARLEEKKEASGAKRKTN